MSATAEEPRSYVVEVGITADEVGLAAVAGVVEQLLNGLSKTAQAGKLLLATPAAAVECPPASVDPALRLRWVDIRAESALAATIQVTGALQEQGKLPPMPALDDIHIRVRQQ